MLPLRTMALVERGLRYHLKNGGDPSNTYPLIHLLTPKMVYISYS